MFAKLASIWKVPELSSFDSALTHQRLVQCGRIVFIDDEQPLLIEELKQAGFAVDHDTTGSELSKYDSQLYDVAILDYHGVGNRLGASQGLDLLRHIRRVSPRTRIISYTSRSLSAAESEFFRLSHAVLPKDMGLGDSLTIIESELRKSMSKAHLFESLLQTLNVTDAKERADLRKATAKSLAGNNAKKIRESITMVAGAVGLKAAEAVLGKLLG